MSTGTSTTPTTPTGQVLRDDDGVRLEFVRTYAAPAADVWAAVTEPDRLARWLGTWTGDPSTGEVQVLMTEDEGARPQPARIEACEEPTRLVVVLASADGPWRLSMELSEDAGTTTLVFVHRLAEPYDASAVGPGWQYYLDRLGAVVTGAPLPRDWDAYYPALADRYPVPA